MIRGDYGGGNGGFTGSRSDRNSNDWTFYQRDPLDLYTFENSRLLARAEDLLRNNPYAIAIVETILQGALGSTGLVAKSLFQEDDDDDTSDEEQGIRRIIDSELANAFSGTSFDAGGQMSKRDMSVVSLASMVTTGDSISVRCFKPDRPGSNTHATCWRIIHSSRVSNPGYAANNKQRYEGFDLDPDGVPYAINVLAANPAALQYQSYDWSQSLIYDPFTKLRNVTHLKSTKIADSIRGFGWLSPILGLLQNLGKTEEAYVIAKRVQACSIYIVEVDNPEAAAAADAKGSVLGGNTKVQPGRVYYVSKGSAVKFLNGNFQGADFEQFSDVLVKNMAAGLNLPVDFVMKQLTKSNLASARAALMQAWATFQVIQDLLIVHCEQPWCESIIYEAWVRGRIPIPREMLRRAFRFRYVRPAQAFPDPAREMVAAEAKIRAGVSFTTVYAGLGLNFEDEIRQRARDEKFLAAQGIRVEDAMPNGGAVAAVAGDSGGPYDPNAPVDDDKNKPADEPSKPNDGDETPGAVAA